MGKFFQQVIASFIGTIIAIGILATAGTAALAMLLFFLASPEQETKLRDKSVLVFDLSLQINDTQPLSTLGETLAGEEDRILSLRQVIKGIEQAAEDKNIVAIFLDGRDITGGTGYANLKEVRQALARFREAGKQIIAYDVDLGEREYYLASVADTIALNPLGSLEINGFSAEQMFFTGALDKYGIGIQVVRVGSYKSAVEPFTRSNFSAENKQQLQAVLTDLWQEFLTTVTSHRQLNQEDLQQLADSQGFLESQKAVSANLVDETAHFDQILNKLKDLTDDTSEEETFPQISLANYIEDYVKGKKERQSENKIAVVYAEGAIVSGEGTVEQIGSDRFTEELRKLRQDDDIKAIVLRINSPGGSATASDIILRELELISQQKPVIVSMGNVAASGGYWLATGAEYIFAQENTITGSIGVFGLLFNIQGIANNNGLTWDTVKTARFADLNTSARPKTTEELALYQKVVNQIYNLFLNKVAESRDLSRDKVAEIAQGRIWSGEDAKTIGLVDEIGGLDAAVEYAATAAELGDDWEVREYPEQRSWEQELLTRLLNSEQTQLIPKTSALPQEFQKLQKELNHLSTFKDPRGVYTLLPFNWHWQ